MNRDRVRLAGISFATLFFELSLVRFVNSTVQVVAYFNNFLILSAFLGIGFGCVSAARRRRDWFALLPPLLVVVVVMALWLDRFNATGGAGADLVIWVRSHQKHDAPAWLVIVLVFFVNFAVFVPLGSELGRTFGRIENKLAAYSWDLAGSFAGVVGFGLLSYFQTPPVVWFSVGGIVIVLLMFGRGPVKVAAAGVLLAVATWLTSVASPGFWSPYYKVSLAPIFNGREYYGFAIFVDQLRIQDAFRFTPAFQHSPLWAWMPYYGLPYALRKPQRVLILGGGSGNDATFALAAGASEVTVVEIDPVIVSLGYVMHPHRPYRDPRVHVVTDDARAFLRRSSETYDMIVMNALDSHHQLPGLSTLRLESFIYTSDAFRDVRRHMLPDSIFVLHLSSTRPWMGMRVYWSLTDAFGRHPDLFTTPSSPWGSTAFVYAPQAIVANARRQGSPLQAVDPKPFLASPNTVRATDDWPQLYLPDRAVPSIYLEGLPIILVITTASCTTVGRIRSREDVHLFLLGAGFMLLETRSLTNASLLFGSTWLVKAIVISGILAEVFAGKLLVQHGVIPGRRACYLALFALPLPVFLSPAEGVLLL